MKKQLFSVSALIIAGAILILPSCKKEDIDAPEITIEGGNAIYHSLNATFANPTATATDEEDGAIADVTVTGTVNEDLAGDYTLTYKATDAAGNEGTATLVVTVRNDAYEWEGSYDAIDSITGITLPYKYAQTVTASTTINNRIHFSEFADYDYNTGIYGTVGATGATVDIPSQTAVGIGNNTESHTFAGTGTKTSTGFKLNYTDMNNSASGATASIKATFTKQ